jgi:hypothetical protein
MSALVVMPFSVKNPKSEARNPKWFEWLTILSEVEGQ